MRDRRNDFLDLHPAAVVAAFFAERAQAGPAARDAEPERAETRPGAVKRLVTVLLRREQPVSPARRTA
jgi:hypothetical protein